MPTLNACSASTTFRTVPNQAGDTLPLAQQDTVSGRAVTYRQSPVATGPALSLPVIFLSLGIWEITCHCLRWQLFATVRYLAFTDFELVTFHP